jgi:hypothetical protein
MLIYAFCIYYNLCEKLLSSSHAVECLLFPKSVFLLDASRVFTPAELCARTEKSADDAGEESRQAYCFAQERVQKRIQHAVSHHEQPKGVVYNPKYVFLHIIAQLVKHIHPIGQAADEKHHHERQNHFEHSNLTLTTFGSPRNGFG